MLNVGNGGIKIVGPNENKQTKGDAKPDAWAMMAWWRSSGNEHK
jgi:hypothetical protein